MNGQTHSRSRADSRTFEVSVVAFSIGAVLLLASWPYLEGLRHVTPRGQFTGLLSGHEDYTTYLVKIAAGREGSLLYRNPYQPEASEALPLHLFWMSLGLVARALGVSTIAVFHGARVGAGALFLLCAYRFLGTCLRQPRLTLLAFILLTVSSGASGLLVHFPAFQGDQFPWFADVLVPEANTFFSLLMNPAFLFCMAMMVVAATSLLRAVRGDEGGWVAGVALLLLGIVHPMSLAAMWLVLGSFVATEAFAGSVSGRKASRLLFTLGGFSAPAVLYYVLLWWVSPEVRSWIVQNLCPSPHPLSYLGGYGMLWIPALAGIVASVRVRRPGTRLACLWLSLGFALLYAPTPIQRRLSEGYHIPVVLVAALGMRGPRRRILWPILIVLSVSTTHLLVRSFAERAGSGSYPSFVEKDLLNAMRWLRETRDGGLVLCAPQNASVITRYGGGRVVAGHWAETPDYAKRSGEVWSFLRGVMQPDEARRWLDRWGIETLLWTPRETAVAGCAAPPLAHWSAAWQGGDVTIWERQQGS